MVSSAQRPDDPISYVIVAEDATVEDALQALGRGNVRWVVVARDGVVVDVVTERELIHAQQRRGNRRIDLTVAELTRRDDAKLVWL